MLTDDELRELNKIAAAVILAPRATVFYEGDENTFFFNVVTGTIRLTKLLTDGRRQITGFLFPGDFLGFWATDVYACSAEAVCETTLCRFPRQGFIKILDPFPTLGPRLFERASNELAEAHTQMLMLGRQTGKERISTTLLNLMKRIGRSDDSVTVIELPMRRKDLADYMGMSIETLSRGITLLQDEGVIKIPNARTIQICRPEELARLSG